MKKSLRETHIVLEGEYVDKEQQVLKTSHERITYEELTQCFIVDLGDGAWCEVYGLNRFTRAVEIANSIDEKYYKATPFPY